MGRNSVFMSNLIIDLDVARRRLGTYCDGVLAI
jgi:hypothetical protein